MAAMLLQHVTDTTQDRHFVDQLLKLKKLCTLLDCLHTHHKDKIGHLVIQLEIDGDTLTKVCISWCNNIECILTECKCNTCTHHEGYYPVIVYGNLRHRLTIKEDMYHVCSSTCSILSSILPTLALTNWRLTLKDFSLYK